MRIRLAVSLFLFAVGCSGSTSTGLDLDGTIELTVGDQTLVPTSGAAVPEQDDPTKMAIIIGTRGVGCGSHPDFSLPSGTYVVANDLSPTVGTMDQAFVGIFRIGGGAHYNGSSAGLTIDSVGERITGSIELMLTDDGEMIDLGANGTFDVTNCLAQ